MSSASGKTCARTEMLFEYALRILPSSEMPAMEAHVAGCSACREELETLQPIVDTVAAWPVDVLRPPASLWERLEQRIAPETETKPRLPAPRRWAEPEWEEVAPGISCKLLATDTEKDRVSMLVRLAPGVAYPPHRHAGVEELYLLDGELVINDRNLSPGDYSRAEADTPDDLVWSKTGCTCVLITSTRDVIC